MSYGGINVMVTLSIFLRNFVLLFFRGFFRGVDGELGFNLPLEG